MSLLSELTVRGFVRAKQGGAIAATKTTAILPQRWVLVLKVMHALVVLKLSAFLEG